MQHIASSSVETFAFLDDGSSVTFFEHSFADIFCLIGTLELFCLKWTAELT